MKIFNILLITIIVIYLPVFSQTEIKTVNGWKVSGGWSPSISYSNIESFFDSSGGQTFNSYGWPLPVNAMTLWFFSITWEKTFSNLESLKFVSIETKLKEGTSIDSVQTDILFDGFKAIIRFKFWSKSFGYIGGNINLKDLKVVDNLGVLQIIDFNNPVILEVEPLKFFPENYILSQNYPNPFNPSTTIRFFTPQSGYVNLVVFNLIGQEVKTLVDEEIRQGNHEVKFDASDLPSGMYIYRLQTGDFVETKKMMFIK
jgi:hypothetical protein